MFFTPEDSVKIRNDEFQSVRDNVIFELGMFIGQLGKKRCFIVSPRSQDSFRIPTDLFGVTYATYDLNREDDNLSAALNPACNKIRQAIEKVQRTQQPLDPEEQEASRQQLTFNELMRAFDSGTFRFHENAIKEDLEEQNLTNSEAIEVLIRHLANAQITLAFNEIDFYIWGSQVELLQYLNSSLGSTAEELIHFYNLAISRSNNPEHFIEYTFEQYLQFLTNRGLITQLTGSYVISQFGRDFLIFLTAKGAPIKGL